MKNKSLFIYLLLKKKNHNLPLQFLFSTIETKEHGGNIMKLRDLLLILVIVYAGYRIIYGNGFTAVNLFLVLCSVIAVISTILERSGYFAKLRKEREELIEKENLKK